jgi:hypothetical protein
MASFPYFSELRGLSSTISTENAQKEFAELDEEVKI